MNSVTRTFGKLTHRSPGDNARVSNLLSDYEDVDRLLAKVSQATGLGRGCITPSVGGPVAKSAPLWRNS